MSDHLKPCQVIAASGTLVLILAAGMTVGPTLGGMAIEHFGPQAVFYLLSVIAVLMVMTALFRLWNTPAHIENRSTAVAVPASLTPETTSFYPDASSRDDSR